MLLRQRTNGRCTPAGHCLIPSRPSLLIAFLLGATALAGCHSAAPPAATGRQAPTIATTIAVASIGHWHVLQPKELSFVVQPAPSEDAAIDVEIAHAEAEQPVRLRAARTAKGPGTYGLSFTPTDVGAYALAARIRIDGRDVVSAPAAFEVVRDGEEGIRIEARGKTFAYQIRYDWVPGRPAASDTSPVRLRFELMRARETGDQVDWAHPWRGTFDLLGDVVEPAVELVSTDGAVRERLVATYAGKGVYQAVRPFSAAEVGTGRDYRVRITFTDPLHGAPVTHVEPYLLQVTAPATGHAASHSGHVH